MKLMEDMNSKGYFTGLNGMPQQLLWLPRLVALILYTVLFLSTEPNIVDIWSPLYDCPKTN